MHYKALQRVLAYLSTTPTLGPTLGLCYKPDQSRNLEVWADSSWSADVSTSGALYFFYGCLVAWFAKRQRCVAHSTAEAEYVGASMAARDGIFYRDVLVDLGVLTRAPTPLLLDSKSAIDMAYDPVAFKKTKHIMRDAHYLRDLVRWWLVTFLSLSTSPAPRSWRTSSPRPYRGPCLCACGRTSSPSHRRHAPPCKENDAGHAAWGTATKYATSDVQHDFEDALRHRRSGASAGGAVTPRHTGEYRLTPTNTRVPL